MFHSVTVTYGGTGEAYYPAVALSNSLLKKTPDPLEFCELWRLLKAGQQPPIEVTDDMRAGQMLEDLLTQSPVRWEDRNGRKGEPPPGTQWIAKAKFSEVSEQAEAIKDAPAMVWLMGAGVQRQVEIYATHTATGLPFKGRFDSMWAYFSPDHSAFIADLKRPGKPKRPDKPDESLWWWLMDYAADVQGALYLLLAQAAAEEYKLECAPSEYIILAAVNKWPYQLQARHLLSTNESHWQQFDNLQHATAKLNARIERAAELIANGYQPEPLTPITSPRNV